MPHTLEVGQEIWRVLAKCHDRRNVAEYEGYLEIDEQLLQDLLMATRVVMDKIEVLCQLQ